MRDDSALEPGDGYVQSLARGLAVIRAFDTDHSRMTLSEVATRTGVARAVARRLLHTLVALGYVRTDGRHFELTAQVLELGYRFIAGQPLAAIAEPVLRDLALSTGESVSVAILDGTEIVYIACIHRRRIMDVDIRVGTRFPAFVTSMGRMLLSGLPAAELEALLDRTEFTRFTDKTITDRRTLMRVIERTRSRGWALVVQELDPGLWAMAAPVVDADGRVVAAVGYSLQVTVTDPPSKRQTEADALVVPLLAAAGELSRAVRGH